MCLRSSGVEARSRGRGKVGKGKVRGRRGRSGAKLISLETFFRVLTLKSWLVVDRLRKEGCLRSRGRHCAGLGGVGQIVKVDCS